MQTQAISETNYAIVAAATAANGCNCVPYEEVKTFKRWQKAGRQVQKGQTSYIRTTSFPEVKVTDPKTGKERVKSCPRCCVLFCKCQTKEIANDAAD